MTSDAYIAGLSERFLSLRPKGLVLSGLDYIIAQRWEEDGIPYIIAYNMITEVMEKFLAARDKDHEEHPERLTHTVPMNYMDRPVREAWREVQGLQTPEIRHP